MKKIIAILTLILVGCQQPSEKSSKQIDKSNVKYFSLNRLSDDLVYNENETIELKYNMNENGDIVFIDKPSKHNEYYSLSNLNNSKSSEELKYSLKEKNDSIASVTISVYQKDKNGEFTLPKMNIGQTSFHFQGRIDLKETIE